MDCHSLLQKNFPTQGLNPGLLHRRQILYRWATGSPSIYITWITIINKYLNNSNGHWILIGISQKSKHKWSINMNRCSTSLVMRDMQIKSPIGEHFITTRLSTILKSQSQVLPRMWCNRMLIFSWLEYKLISQLRELLWHSFIHLMYGNWLLCTWYYSCASAWKKKKT